MNSLRVMLVGTVLAGGVGCVHLQPVGPMAKTLGVDEPGTKTVAPGVKVTAAKDAAAFPQLPTAPPPVPPALLVTPGEVTEANSEAAARRLIDEMEADRKGLEKMPRYAEMSVIKGGR